MCPFFPHLPCKAFVIITYIVHNLYNRKIKLKQLEKLKLIAMCIILIAFPFFLRLCGTEIWDNSKRSKEPYDDKDKQHNQVL